MKYELFDFQETALGLLRDKVLLAREHASSQNPQAISFSAPTGSGKTVIMAALFENILFGDAAGLPAQPDATILWVSDMPELNEQTRRRINQVSNRIGEQRLVTIDAGFDREQLEPGVIHFINVQKLGTDKRLTRGGTDGRQYSIWTTFSNTARAIPDRFYVVIDEAHRGMAGGKQAKEARTLIQRFLLGHIETGLIRMPLVIGVSATPKRFTDLLEGGDHTQHPVRVPVAEVRASGLLKDRIPIHHPKEAGHSEMALLAEAAAAWVRMSQAWDAYCKAEQEQRVWPILVVQVENGTERQPSRTDLGVALNVIEKAIGRPLLEGEAVHALHDCGDMDLGGRRVRRVDASRIDEDKGIGVVFFKTSLSTGWDCPRAEVMMSFRRAEDHTYIAQLLGRMVRTPLARRIERDAALNDVHLFLPYFDDAAVKAVVEDLKDVEHAPPAVVGSSRELVTLSRRTDAADIFAAMAGLVTYRVNAARAQGHLRRFVGLARRLNLDDIEPAAWGAAKEQVVAWLGTELDGLKATGTFAKSAAAIMRVGMKTTTLDTGSELVTPVREYEIDASEADIERQFSEAGQRLGNGLHQTWWDTHADREALDVKVEVILLARSHAVMAGLEAKGETAFDALYDRHKHAIGKLKEKDRVRYERLRLATAKPVEMQWRLPERIEFRRTEGAPDYERHLYLEDDGRFRADLETWERELIAEEVGNPEVVGWFRNQDRKPWSLEIPYLTGGAERPMFPDLVVVRQGEAAGSAVGGYRFDILEPHDPSLADNFEKAVGLARFAERHGHLFHRIQLIRKQPSKAGGECYVRLELNSEAVRKQVLLVTANPQLDALFA
ncbi:DEAD/DEAH box helicase family protein [uncultured Thiodictyon sp.]|jgi:type III restriction enzyme|uniref:DEAD/DEAH box helicase n=1 Tax=uncultured Thiodictyon sp. TaxID=1846217 RepID=UPI0025D90B6E|nr:DEAD/DEAH box helicase family protein [uncultured Thiodictyon sp.]